MLQLIIYLIMLQFTAESTETNSFYNFTVKTIDGKDFDFNTLKGKKVMIVNTASECGYTPQYHELEILFETYSKNNFTILGFPANNFGAQEPGTDSEIKSFCTKNYGVSFTMMSKISVTGEDMHPLYSWLTHKSENGVADAKVKWNFQKFLINADGSWEAVIPHTESPMSDRIIEWIGRK
jgi:glutathione peroxidase